MYNSFQNISTALKNKSLTCEKVVKYYLKRIKNKKNINVFTSVYGKEVLKQAKEIDSKRIKGKTGRLAGLVVGIKDVIAYKNHPLQAASTMLKGFIARNSSKIVKYLLSEDAIIIGHQNCDEFAMGISNQKSAFGFSRNPVDFRYVPGGSSGGSAAAVKANLCLVSLGTDTAGSVRQPAAFCGVIGLKPTHNLISLEGVIPYAPSFDTVGILGNTFSDINLVFNCLADKKIAIKEEKNDQKYSLPEYKIAYLKESFDPVVETDVQKAFQLCLNYFQERGLKVLPINFKEFDYLLPAYRILSGVEANDNLAPYNQKGYETWFTHDPTIDYLTFIQKNINSLGDEVLSRLLLGRLFLTKDISYYKKAKKLREVITQKTLNLLDKYDFIISPTSPTTAFKIGDFTKKTLKKMALSDRFTIHASMTGIPAISLNIGYDKKGLPIGLHIMTAPFKEAKLLMFSQLMYKH